MRRINKNLIIGVLVSIVCVMAVGYAAFSTSLTINSSSSIDSTWNVKYDTTGTTNYVVTNGIGNATAPNTTVAANNTDAIMSFTDTQATLTTKLYQPGDKVVYTLTVRNEGTLKAGLSVGTVGANGCTVSSNTYTCGYIKYTVGSFSKSTLAAKNGSTVDTATIQVTAEFKNDVTISVLTQSQSASITIPLSAVQVK